MKAVKRPSIRNFNFHAKKVKLVVISSVSHYSYNLLKITANVPGLVLPRIFFWPKERSLLELTYSGPKK